MIRTHLQPTGNLNSSYASSYLHYDIIKQMMLRQLIWRTMQSLQLCNFGSWILKS